MALFSGTQDVNRLTRAAVAWWGVGQLLVLAAYLAAATRGMPPWAVIIAVVAGTTMSLAATVVATFAASQAWPGLISKAAFRCVVLWFASGSCALAWLAVWLVR